MKYPFIKFYVRDWQSDMELRMCSLEARGFWFECLCIMHNAKRRGYLESAQGLALTSDQTACLIGTFKGDVKRCLQELFDHEVYSVDEKGVIYCRRMVKDAAKSEKCSNAGKKGGGSPLITTKDKIPDTRNHISLKDTFKGGEDFDIPTAKDVLDYFKIIKDRKDLELTRRRALSVVENYIDSRTESEWIKANNQPVKNWKNDFNSWVNHYIVDGKISEKVR